MASAQISPILFSPGVSVPSKTLYAGWNLVSLSYFYNVYSPTSGGSLAPYDALACVYYVSGANNIGYSQVVSPAVNQDVWYGTRSADIDSINGSWDYMYICKGYWVSMVNGGTLAGMVFTPVSPLP